MKILFVGPSLPDANQFTGNDVIVRPPAIQGDVRRAVEAGVRTIGLVDGAFEYAAPVWHKEILYGLSKGVAIYGAASMGALRAVECRTFGMIGLGEIFEGYASGRLVDDADVALIYGPAELDYVSLSLPMVNVSATITRCANSGLITRREASQIEESARALFFKKRSWSHILASCLDTSAHRPNELRRILRHHYVDQKRQDALLLVDALRRDQRSASPQNRWVFNQTSLWRAG